MRKSLIIVFLVAIVAILLFIAYSYLGGYPVGFKNGRFLIRSYFCSDVCPTYGHWNTIYSGIKNQVDCNKIGGRPIIDPAWGGFEGCAPITNAPQSPTPMTNNETANWKTYSNTKYGFEIKYPNDFELYTNVNKMKILSYIPVCNPDMAVCLYYSKDNQRDTNFGGAGISVDILKNSGTEASCLMVKEGEEKTGFITLDGVNFDIYKGGGATAGHLEEYFNYRAFKNNYCYQITLRKTETNISNFDPSLGVKEYDWNEVMASQEQVLSTFKFTK